MKKLLVVLLLLACVFALAGCGDSASDGPADQELQPALSEGETPAEGTAGKEETEKLNAILEMLADADPALTVTLFTDDDTQIGPFDGRQSAYTSRTLTHYPWERLESAEKPAASTAIRLAAEDEAWTLQFYEKSNLLELIQGEDTLFFTTKLSPAEWEERIWKEVRSWFDGCEFAALGGYWTELKDGEPLNKAYVIPDTGQSFLEAAQEAVQAVDNIHLQASSGSKECYTYIRCFVSFAEEMTRIFRKNGEIGENTYCILVERILVPENDRAAFWAMAGEYTGDDPDVPEGALRNQLCGYVSQEADGWHVEIVGTGW